MDVNHFSQAPTLFLGYYDANKTIDKKAYLMKYHKVMSPALQNKLEFKGEHTGQWRPFVPVNGQHVQALQTFLKNAGFMPNHEPDGIYGYETISGVRLFQEYMRTIKGKQIIPDSIAGAGTYRAIQEWQKQNYICEWNQGMASDEHSKWIDILKKRKTHFLNNPNVVFNCREHFSGSTDTRKIADWDVAANSVHLIGIRRNQKKSYYVNSTDTDLFVLLINGMVFKFFGSTVPNPGLVESSTFPFLLEGQHLYRLGWHKRSSASFVYEAWRPATRGILVFRRAKSAPPKDIIHDEQSMKRGLQLNDTINIHWSGRGSYNFSAGCQVIGGSSYVNNKGEIIDDGKYATVNKRDLDKHHTKAAYNMLLDLFTCYAPNETRTLAYSLIREETLYELGDWPNPQHIADLVKKMNGNIVRSNKKISKQA